jgi:hypothetical protein
MANTFTFIGNVTIPKGEDKKNNSKFATYNSIAPNRTYTG